VFVDDERVYLLCSGYDGFTTIGKMSPPLIENAGWGGDTAAGALKRLERDVFKNGATC